MVDSERMVAISNGELFELEQSRARFHKERDEARNLTRRIYRAAFTYYDRMLRLERDNAALRAELAALKAQMPASMED